MSTDQSWFIYYMKQGSSEPILIVKLKRDSEVEGAQVEYKK